MNDAPQSPEDLPPRLIPYSFWWPIGAGALVGLLMRLVFSGEAGAPVIAMSVCVLTTLANGGPASA
jgi:hypothetical protein